MLDFSPVRKKELTMNQLVADLELDDFRRLTNEMVDAVLGMMADCVDADVTFVPDDPDAHDTFAADEADVDLAWTLGHVVVHITASSEETAAIAAELARGVEFHGRSRSETPWETVTSLAQCRQRLEESRRMRLASLDMWPDHPYMDNTVEWGSQAINPRAYFVGGLSHADSHLEQIKEIVRQAKQARDA